MSVICTIIITLTSERFAFNRDFEALVIDEVRLKPPEIGSALEYPELISSEERML